MTKKLDKKDISILWELSKNARVKLPIIANKVKIPKATVNYRIEQLIKEGILNKMYAIVDMAKFHFLFYEIFVKLQAMPKEKELQCLESLSKHPYLGWLVSTTGRFSFLCSVFVREPSQFYVVYAQVKELFHPYIKEIAINITFNGMQFAYPFFKDLQQTSLQTKMSNRHKYTCDPILNNTQHKLLILLAENARMPLITIANTLKTTEKTVRKYIKQLEKDRYILNYTCQLHPGRVNYFFHLIIMRVNVLNNTLEEFLKQIPEIFYIVKGAGFYDIKAEFYVQQENRIYDIQREIYAKFSTIIAEMDIMQITKEYLVRYFTEA
jgi:DNA-binding Lrp family transcriptional regulator